MSSRGYNLLNSMSLKGGIGKDRGTDVTIKVEVFNDSEQPIDSQHLHSDDEVEIRRGLELESNKSFSSQPELLRQSTHSLLKKGNKQGGDCTNDDYD
jgi:hypothetical protein